MTTNNGATNNPAAYVNAEAKGFFATLLDFDFKHFVTIKFAKFVYILALILGGLVWLFALIAALAGFSQGFAEGLLMTVGVLLGGAVMYTFYVVMLRLQIEFVVSMVRTAQNTGELADMQRANQNPGGEYGQY